MAKFLSEAGLRYFYNQIKSKFAAASHNHSAGNITSGTLPIANGGTGATTAAGVRNALGLGNTTGALPVANGGTGATTAAGVRNALGLGNTTGALPVANGGTGATTAANAVKALLGTSALGSSTKPIYYDGAALKACADSIGGGGIVAQLLEENGYVKFANGLILQWGKMTFDKQVVTVEFPISFTNFKTVTATKCRTDAPWHPASGPLAASMVTNSNFKLGSEQDYGSTIAVLWIAIGK